MQTRVGKGFDRQPAVSVCGGDGIGDRPAVFAARVLLDLQRGVIAAAPVQNHVDEAVLDPHNDLMQNGAYDPLARRHGGGRM
jgi:hypothetical protein